MPKSIKMECVQQNGRMNCYYAIMLFYDSHHLFSVFGMFSRQNIEDMNLFFIDVTSSHKCRRFAAKITEFNVVQKFDSDLCVVLFCFHLLFFDENSPSSRAIKEVFFSFFVNGISFKSLFVHCLRQTDRQTEEMPATFLNNNDYVYLCVLLRYAAHCTYVRL